MGDPRFYARVDRRWEGGLRLGARAGLWLPGRNAPSLDAGALSPEIAGIASYAAPSAPIALTANVGYRLDRSAHSAPDAALLSAGDRMALGVSAFDAVLVGAAATIGRGPAQGFVEASADLLVGSGAPPAGSSPMFVGGGGRLAVGRNLRIEAELEISPSHRPDTGPLAPLVPIPPRFGAWLGLAYRFGAAPRPPPPPPPPLPPAPATVTLRGHVSAADGGKLADLHVQISSGDARRDIPVDDDGRFSAEGKPGEELAVSAEAADHLPGRAAVTLATGAPNTVDLTLERRPRQGQIRGLVRSLRGAAVAAEIAVEPETPAPGAAGEAKQLRAEDGRFQIDVVPGHYRVTISAPGYEVQKRTVDVEENGVTVLNVDLRREP